LSSTTCAGCEPVEMYSSVSQEELDARAPRRAIDEFEFNQRKSIESYVETTRSVIEHANALVVSGQGKAAVPITLHLRDEFFDFKQLREANEETSRRLWEERSAQLEPSQAFVRRLVESLDGEITATLQLANIVYAQVPASAVGALREAADTIVGLELEGVAAKPDANGIERRNALVMNDDGLRSWGWEGNDANRLSNGAVRVAVIEASAPIGAENRLNTSYLGFRERAPSSTTAIRVVVHRKCTPGCAVIAAGSYNTHGTRVTSALLSDFEQGQADPTAMSTLTRLRRGGIAQEAEVLYYIAEFGSDVASAINDAVALGADIINMSMSPTGDYCHNSSFSGLRSAIQTATNSGVLVVVSAGNDGDLGANCRVNSYGAIPDSLTVGAVDDVVDYNSLATVGVQAYVPPSPPPGTPPDPTTYSGSNTAYQTMNIAGGIAATARMVELAVTGAGELLASDGELGTTAANGTSYAAPQVAGAAAVLKDWMYSAGGYAANVRNDPYVLAGLLTVMSDGAYGAFGSGETQNQFDGNFGFGHLRFTVPSFLGDNTYAYHRVHTPLENLQEGDEFEWTVGKDTGPEPTQIQGWKLSALIDHDWYDSSPVITFQLRDRCAPGWGGQPQPLLNSTITTHKARLRMRAADMANLYHNRCLWVRGYVAKVNGPFTLHLTEYAYTNSRAYHDM
jgi:hypothetical protein